MFILANIYQPTYKKWMGMMLQFEYSASGLVYPWSRFATVDLDGYASIDGTMYAAFDVILVVLAFTALMAWRDQYKYVDSFGSTVIVGCRAGAARSCTVKCVGKGVGRRR